MSLFEERNSERKDKATAALSENRQRMPGEKCMLSHFFISESMVWIAEQTGQRLKCVTKVETWLGKRIQEKKYLYFQELCKKQRKGH